MRSASSSGWLVFALLLASYAYFFQGGGWNPNSRLDLTRALAEHGTIRIDAYRQNTGDWALREGHYYTNKGVGLSLLSLPAYVAAGPIAHSLHPQDSEARLRLRAYAANVTTNGVAGALLGVVLFQLLGTLGLGSPTLRAWCVLGLGLGTLVFPYATAYYSHTLAAAASFGAFWLLGRARIEGRPGLAWLAGGAAGLAVLVENSTAIAVAILALALAFDASDRRLLARFVGGGLPSAAALGGYNALAFGSPFDFGLDHVNPATSFRRDGALFGWPTPGTLAWLLVSPQRGLLFSSPILGLAALGALPLYRRDRFCACVCAGVFGATLLVIAAFHGAFGGSTPGPRYLIVALPYLFVPTALGMARWRVPAWTLGSISAAAMLAITAVAVEVPSHLRNPLADFVLPHLVEGHISVNAQGLDAYRRPEGYERRRFAPDPSSWNLGELVLPERPLSLLPLLALWAAGAQLLLRARPRPGEV